MCPTTRPNYSAMDKGMNRFIQFSLKTKRTWKVDEIITTHKLYHALQSTPLVPSLIMESSCSLIESPSLSLFCLHSDQVLSRDTARRNSEECEKANCVTVREWWVNVWIWFQWEVSQINMAAYSCLEAYTGHITLVDNILTYTERYL